VGNRNFRRQVKFPSLFKIPQSGSSWIKIKEKTTMIIDGKGGCGWLPIDVVAHLLFLLKYPFFYGAKSIKQRYRTFTMFSVLCLRAKNRHLFWNSHSRPIGRIALRRLFSMTVMTGKP